MNFKEQLVDSGRLVGEMVTKNVGNNPEYYSQILDLVLYETMPMSSRAGRVLILTGQKYPNLIKPHVNRLIEYIGKRDTVHRCVLQLFAEFDIETNEDQAGILIDKCFQWLVDEKQSVANKIYSMTILEKYVYQYPELKQELIAAIELNLPTGSKGVKHRGKRTIERLNCS